MRKTCLAAAVVATAVFAVRADDKKDTKPFDEREFVTKAASGGMMEIELGKVAAAYGKSAEVKKFGMKMAEDHTKANDELKAVAGSAGVQLPAKMMDEHQKHFDMLKGKTADEFDKAYVEHMVKDHEEDVKAFTRASKDAPTPAIKEFATKTLPTLQKHLDEIKKIRDQAK